MLNALISTLFFLDKFNIMEYKRPKDVCTPLYMISRYFLKA